MLKEGDLVVSCQALEDEPLHSSFIMSRMALAAKQGGAKGIRANSIEDISEIKKVVDLPIIGIIKKVYSDSEIHITASYIEVEALVKAGADIIALDATNRIRPGGINLEEFFETIKADYPEQKWMADCSTVEEMLEAERLGFDYIGTTLFGYTPYSKGPILENEAKQLKTALAVIKSPIIAEGNVNTPELARFSIDLGCYAVVVGSMITRPQLITQKFSNAIKSENI